jgi:hypothetical protein
MLQESKKKEAATVQQTQEVTKKLSPIDELRSLTQQVNQISKANPHDLAAKAHEVIAQIEDIKTKLATPNLELKSSVQHELKNKLTHIDESLRITLSKAGIEYKVPEKPNNITNPIEHFLGFLTDGQYQLEHLADEVQTMQLNKNEISPANMLALQIKVGFVQQELEFFTSLLNKALESTKTILNVQV